MFYFGFSYGLTCIVVCPQVVHAVETNITFELSPLCLYSIY